MNTLYIFSDMRHTIQYYIYFFIPLIFHPNDKKQQSIQTWWMKDLEHKTTMQSLLKQLNYSHLGPSRFPYDQDSEWVVNHNDFVKPLALISLRSSRNRQRHWNLITIHGRVPDLDKESEFRMSENLFVCLCGARGMGSLKIRNTRERHRDTQTLLCKRMHNYWRTNKHVHTLNCSMSLLW